MDIRTDRTYGSATLSEVSKSKKAAPPVDLFAAVAGSGDDVEAELSTTGLLLNQLNDQNLNTSKLIFPSLDNVRRLTIELTPLLSDFAAQNKISTDPPLEFQIEPSGKLVLRGERPDEELILKQLAANPQLERAVRNTTAIASHAFTLHIERHAQFQQEYRAASNPAAVVAKYSELFGPPKDHDVSLRFGSDGVSILGDHQVWQAVKSQHNE